MADFENGGWEDFWAYAYSADGPEYARNMCRSALVSTLTDYITGLVATAINNYVTISAAWDILTEKIRNPQDMAKEAEGLRKYVRDTYLKGQ